MRESDRRPKPPASRRAKSAPVTLASYLGPLFLLALLVGSVFGRVPAWLVFAYVFMSGMTLACYRLDKSAAINNRQRTPERRLHLLALSGGWPGALLAQAMFRHKSSKTAFLWRFWSTVLLNLALLAGLLASGWGMGLDRAIMAGWAVIHALVTPYV